MPEYDQDLRPLRCGVREVLRSVSGGAERGTYPRVPAVFGGREKVVLDLLQPKRQCVTFFIQKDIEKGLVDGAHSVSKDRKIHRCSSPTRANFPHQDRAVRPDLSPGEDSSTRASETRRFRWTSQPRGSEVLQPFCFSASNENPFFTKSSR